MNILDAPYSINENMSSVHLQNGERIFVYLTYIDDSDTKDKSEKWQVMAAVMIPDNAFNISEFMASFVIESLIPPEKLDQFEEFHACELFGGYGVFKDIEQGARLSAIQSLLQMLDTFSIPIAFSAVNLDYLKQQDFSSANPQDMAFRSCVKGIQKWLSDTAMENFQKADASSGKISWDSPMALLIADDGDNKSRAQFQRSFREMRKRVRPPSHRLDASSHFHDDMYFGDSKYSIGIQLADLCAFFIAKHLEKKPEAEGFYQLISNQMVFSKIHPGE